MKIKSMPAGQRPSVQRKYIVIDRTRYLPDRSVCPSSPAQPWSVYEDLSPACRATTGHLYGRRSCV